MEAVEVHPRSTPISPPRYGAPQTGKDLDRQSLSEMELPGLGLGSSEENKLSKWRSLLFSSHLKEACKIIWENKDQWKREGPGQGGEKEQDPASKLHLSGLPHLPILKFALQLEAASSPPQRFENELPIGSPTSCLSESFILDVKGKYCSHHQTQLSKY